MTATIQTATYYIAIALFMMVIHDWHKRYASTGSYYWAGAVSLLTAPGTYLHELSHAIVGFLTGARPTRLSIVPNLKQNAEGKIQGTFGVTEFANVNAFNGAFVGLAPLLLIPVGLSLIGLTTWESPLLKVLEAWLVASVLYDAKPSSMDLEIAKRFWYGPVILGAAAVALVLL
jgi:hypothetical protein